MIGNLLGHADVQTTTRYAHLDDGHVIEAAQRIGDLIEQSMDEKKNSTVPISIFRKT